MTQPSLFTPDAYGSAIVTAPAESESTIQERFEKFHQEHPEIYAALVELAWTWKRAGQTKCGIKMLWERLRWEMGMRRRPGEEFLADNNFHSRFVRLLCEREPDLAGMFELRELRAK